MRKTLQHKYILFCIFFKYFFVYLWYYFFIFFFFEKMFEDYLYNALLCVNSFWNVIANLRNLGSNLRFFLFLCKIFVSKLLFFFAIFVSKEMQFQKKKVRNQQRSCSFADLRIQIQTTKQNKKKYLNTQ